MPTSSNNFSALLQFLHQELLSSESHDESRDKLLTYFQEAGCDKSQLDIINSSFHKATLDTKAFGAVRADQKQHVSPVEFSHRLVGELAKKYKDTQAINSRICQLEASLSSPMTSRVPLEEAVNTFSQMRMSSLNLEAAIINMCDMDLRLQSDDDGQDITACKNNNRYSSEYDKQILTLRKKLTVSDSLSVCWDM